MLPALAVASDKCPVAAGPPAGETEVTPEMIEAGYRVLCESGISDDPLEADTLLVEKIYLTMHAARHLAERGSHRRRAD